MQDEVNYEGEDRKAHALSLIQGWDDKLGIRQAIESTPTSDMTRSRVVDRCALQICAEHCSHGTA